MYIGQNNIFEGYTVRPNGSRTKFMEVRFSGRVNPDTQEWLNDARETSAVKGVYEPATPVEFEIQYSENGFVAEAPDGMRVEVVAQWNFGPSANGQEPGENGVIEIR